MRGGDNVSMTRQRSGGGSATRRRSYGAQVAELGQWHSQGYNGQIWSGVEGGGSAATGPWEQGSQSAMGKGGKGN
uniref:Uncharacterized protein n=1 Tax=Oryza glumipatula TaxID=40148 RepID=A0A0E0ABW7_9ORYZ